MQEEKKDTSIWEYGDMGFELDYSFNHPNGIFYEHFKRRKLIKKLINTLETKLEKN